VHCLSRHPQNAREFPLSFIIQALDVAEEKDQMAVAYFFTQLEEYKGEGTESLVGSRRWTLPHPQAPDSPPLQMRDVSVESHRGFIDLEFPLQQRPPPPAARPRTLVCPWSAR